MVTKKRNVFLTLLFCLFLCLKPIHCSDETISAYDIESVDTDNLDREIARLTHELNTADYKQKLEDSICGSQQQSFNNTILASKTFDDGKTRLTLALKNSDLILGSFLFAELAFSWLVQQQFTQIMQQQLITKLIALPNELETDLEHLAELQTTEGNDETKNHVTEKLATYFLPEFYSKEYAYTIGASIANTLSLRLSQIWHDNFLLTRSSKAEHLGWVAFLSVIQAAIKRADLKKENLQESIRFVAPALMPHIQELDSVHISCFDLLQILCPVQLTPTNTMVRLCELLNSKLCPEDSLLQVFNSTFVKDMIQTCGFVWSIQTQNKQSVQRFIQDITQNYPTYQGLLKIIHTKNAPTKALALHELSHIVEKTLNKPFFALLDQQNRTASLGKVLVLGPITLILILPIVIKMIPAITSYLRQLT
ncbi:MAG: hypothetical protein H6679_00235 [Epsilonproteobacteria bacterium]|nr:hypothetical protein [Campylobacterota bacterium]